MSTTILHLPFPPTVNSLYDGGMKTRRRFKSKRYTDWWNKAFDSLMLQEYCKHSGNVEIDYVLIAPDKRRRDLSNYVKAVEDFLVSRNVIPDDSNIFRFSIQWGEGEVGIHMVINDA